MGPSLVAALMLVQAAPGAAFGANTPRPLPENRPCAYPAAARRQSVVGLVRFTLVPAEEHAIRELLESLSVAWNADDWESLEDLEARGRKSLTPTPHLARSLQAQLHDKDSTEKCRLELESGLFRAD